MSINYTDIHVEVSYMCGSCKPSEKDHNTANSVNVISKTGSDLSPLQIIARVGQKYTEIYTYGRVLGLK